MNITVTEQKIEALGKRIAKLRTDHKKTSHLVAEQKRLSNSILAQERIKEFTDKMKAKEKSVQQRVDELNPPFDTYRPLGQTEQPTHEEIRRDTDAQRDANYAMKKGMHVAECAADPGPNHPPTLWQRLKNFEVAIRPLVLTVLIVLGILFAIGIIV